MNCAPLLVLALALALLQAPLSSNAAYVGFYPGKSCLIPPLRRRASLSLPRFAPQQMCRPALVLALLASIPSLSVPGVSWLMHEPSSYCLAKVLPMPSLLFTSILSFFHTLTLLFVDISSRQNPEPAQAFNRLILFLLLSHPPPGNFVEAFDALKLATVCGLPRPAAPPPPPPPAPPPPAAGSQSLFVDSVKGSDSNPGTQSQPLRSIQAAVDKRAQLPATVATTIVLRAGIHQLNQTIQLSPAHSNTTFENFPLEQAVVTGATPLRISSWTAYRVNASGCTNNMCTFNNSNDVYGQAPGPGLVNMSTMATASQCAALCAANSTCIAFTHHGPSYDWPYKLTCWFRTGDESYWSPTPEQDVVSGCKPSLMPGCQTPGTANVFVTDVSAQLTEELWGLHILSSSAGNISAHRAVLARHPNSDPELSPLFVGSAAAWGPPFFDGCETAEVVTESNLPDNYPGMNQNFLLGVNGTCANLYADNSRYGGEITISGLFPSALRTIFVQMNNVLLAATGAKTMAVRRLWTAVRATQPQ